MKLLKLATTFLVICSGLSAEEDKHPQKKSEKPEFVAELGKANKLQADKKLVEAEKAYRALRAKDVNNTTWAMASNNLGINLRIQKKYKQSTKVFNEILAKKLNNRDKGQNIMAHFRNYHYNACIEMMRNYHFSGDNAEAIKALKLTKSKHLYESCCATCRSEADQQYSTYLKFLEGELAKKNSK